MAVVRANVRWLGPSALVPCKAKSCDVGSSSAAGLFFQPQQIYSGQKGYSSLTCRASSGGSRRDYEKILARQKNRRVRHMKGVTPSTPDLINTLESEKRDQAKLDSRLAEDGEYDYEYDNVENQEELEDSDTADVRPA